MARIILLILAALSLVASGWLTIRLLDVDQDLEETDQRSERIKAQLQSFEFDGNGNVAPDKEQDMRLALLDGESAVKRLAQLREQRSEILTFLAVGAGATLVFGLLWFRGRRR